MKTIFTFLAVHRQSLPITQSPSPHAQSIRFYLVERCAEVSDNTIAARYRSVKFNQYPHGSRCALLLADWSGNGNPKCVPTVRPYHLWGSDSSNSLLGQRYIAILLIFIRIGYETTGRRGGITTLGKILTSLPWRPRVGLLLCRYDAESLDTQSPLEGRTEPKLGIAHLTGWGSDPDVRGSPSRGTYIDLRLYVSLDRFQTSLKVATGERPESAKVLRA